MTAIIQCLTANPNLTNAMATVASALIALFALITSVVSIFLAWSALRAQRKHGYLSVRPLAAISRGDYENRISVKIHNNGIGPLIITNVNVTKSDESKSNVIDWMPSLPEGITYEDFVKGIVGRSLAPNKQVVLLQLSGDSSDALFAKARDACREALKDLTVKIEYKDIYERAMPEAERDLAWFGRHG